eukprot:7391458-Prymnesium_polylepis.2
MPSRMCTGVPLKPSSGELNEMSGFAAQLFHSAAERSFDLLAAAATAYCSASFAIDSVPPRSGGLMMCAGRLSVDVHGSGSTGSIGTPALKVSFSFASQSGHGYVAEAPPVSPSSCCRPFMSPDHDATILAFIVAPSPKPAAARCRCSAAASISLSLHLTQSVGAEGAALLPRPFARNSLHGARRADAAGASQPRTGGRWPPKRKVTAARRPVRVACRVRPGLGLLRAPAAPAAPAAARSCCGRRACATMPTVFVHVGQAGNEIAGAFWRLASAEKPPKRWLFDERGCCRAVLVDTEPKVVRSVASALGAERLHPRCALVEQGGRGNNWAMGYNGVDGGGGASGSVADAALEALRWQVERCDWFSGLVLCHSIGGGTGAGLGSLLLQEARDAYPRRYITAASMSPFAAGELPLGYYNATLALSFLQEFSDTVLLFDNAALLNNLSAAATNATTASSHSSRAPPRCSQTPARAHSRLQPVRSLRCPAPGACGPCAARAPGMVSTLSPGARLSCRRRLCMKQIDDYVARSLAGLVFPTDGAAGRRPFDAGDLVSSVCPMPANKFLQLHSSPPPPPPAGPSSGAAAPRDPLARGTASGALRPASWEMLVADCFGRLPRYDLHNKPVVSLCSQVIARGAGAEPPEASTKERVSTVLGPSPVSPWPVDWKLSSSAQTALPSVGAQRTLTVVSNRCSIAPHLEQMSLRARLQLSAKAYVHHYEQHGVSADYIASRLEVVQQVVDDYNAMSAAVAGLRKPGRLSL